jgi:hypothetical protein
MHTDLATLTAEAWRLSGLLDKGIAALRDAAVAYAEAEHEYRERKAMAYLETEQGTVAEREAHVYAMVGDFRRVRDLADGQRLAALEAVRSRRSQLSALQSIIAAHRSESELAR